MKRVLSTIAALSMLICFAPSEAFSQAQQRDETNPVKYGQAGMTFLKIDVGGRAAAMGGTNASVQGSVYDMFSNPAGLAFVEGAEVAATVTNWIADITHNGGGAAYNLGNAGTVGISYVVMDYGDFTRTIPYEGTDPTLRNQGFIEDGTFSVTEMALGLAYAKSITNAFHVGGHLRFATQDLGNVTIFDEVAGTNVDAENSVSNMIIDFGTMYYPGWQDLRFGMSIRNFSNQSDYYDQRFELPLTFDFGLAMNVMPLISAESDQNLTVAANWLHPRDFGERFHVGAEYAMMDMFFVRGGYKFNYDAESFAGGIGVNVGTGSAAIKADYSYSAFGEFFGAVHRVGIGVGLNR